MTTKKVIELLSESEESWEAAAQKAVADASESLRGAASICINAGGVTSSGPPTP